MFTKRKQRAEEWSMNSLGQRKVTQPVAKFESLDCGMPAFSMQKEFGYNHVRHHPDPIKSKLNAAELEQIQHNQDSLCKHDSLPPNLAFDVNQALATSHGKAGQFFEKRKQRADKYIVDEDSRKNWQPQNTVLQTQLAPPDSSPLAGARLYKSPWEAAVEGRLESAFEDSQQLVYQQPPQLHQPLNVITNQPGTAAMQLNAKNQTFKPVTPGYSPAFSGLGVPSAPKQKTRLEMMLEAKDGPTLIASQQGNTNRPFNHGRLMGMSTI